MGQQGVRGNRLCPETSRAKVVPLSEGLSKARPDPGGVAPLQCALSPKSLCLCHWSGRDSRERTRSSAFCRPGVWSCGGNTEGKYRRNERTHERTN